MPSTEPTDSSDRPLQRLWECGVLLEIDYHFGRTLQRLDPDASPWLGATGALASRAVQAGHVCLDLQQLTNAPLLDVHGGAHAFAWPSVSQWHELLRASPLVGEANQACALVLEGSRVYLPRYAHYQLQLADALRERATGKAELDVEQLRALLERHFPHRTQAAPDRQRLAALLAASRRLTVISGGPGTGKTTTVAKILAILVEATLTAGLAAPRIALLAPTGKAAQRMSDSLSAGLSTLDIPANVREAIPVEASTIHRALGTSSRTPTRFIRNRHRPLSADIVLVDEASMVDLALMAKLVDAVRPEARLLLLGDKDQLASVEAGAIFGDIFNAAADHRYSDSLVELGRAAGFSDLPSGGPAEGLQDCTVHLVKNYRYGDDSSIARLANALRVGDADTAIQAISDGDQIDWVISQTEGEGRFERAVTEHATRGYRAIVESSEPEARLEALGRYRLLCAHREGSRGVAGLNRLAAGALEAAGLIDARSHLYDGRPIMITENDYQLQLFNGDVGVVCRDASDSRLWVFFPSAEGVRRLPASRLPAHETVFAMTVHKSQGSEFDHVALVLPEKPSPVLCRELIYTGVTRARRQLSLFGGEDVLRDGIARPVQRASGLRDALWGAATTNG